MPKRINNLLSKNPIAVRVYIGDELLLKEYCQRYKIVPSVAVRYIIHQYFILTEQLADRKREAQRYDLLGQTFGNKELTLPLATEILSAEDLPKTQAEQELSGEGEKHEQTQQPLSKKYDERPPVELKEWSGHLAEAIGAILVPELTEQLTTRLVKEISEKLQASNETNRAQIVETLSAEFGQPLNRLVEMLFKHFEEKTSSTSSTSSQKKTQEEEILKDQDEEILRDIFEIANDTDI